MLECDARTRSWQPDVKTGTLLFAGADGLAPASLGAHPVLCTHPAYAAAICCGYWVFCGLLGQQGEAALNPHLLWTVSKEPLHSYAEQALCSGLIRVGPNDMKW